MSKYPLEALMSIRERRYDKHTKDRMLKQKLLEQARNTVLQKEKELKEYRQWRIEEEARRYNSIMNNNYSIEKIQIFNVEIKQLGVKELELSEEVKKLEIKVDEAKGELELAEKIERESHKKLQKLDTHKTLWKAEQRLLELREEDQEMEDFTVKDMTKF